MERTNQSILKWFLHVQRIIEGRYGQRKRLTWEVELSLLAWVFRRVKGELGIGIIESDCVWEKMMCCECDSHWNMKLFRGRGGDCGYVWNTVHESTFSVVTIMKGIVCSEWFVKYHIFFNLHQLLVCVILSFWKIYILVL